MTNCPRCGAEVEDEAKFCSYCGAAMTPEAEREAPPQPRTPPHPRYEKQRSACFGPPGSGYGIWGAISGGVFIIGLGVLWYYDLWWPGILFLIGAMIVIGGIVSLARRSIDRSVRARPG